MTQLGKQIAKPAAPTTEERERRIKLTEEINKEHESHDRLTDVCKFCIYKAAFMLDQGGDEETAIARNYLSKISLPVVNEAIATVDFALDMKGLVKPFVAGELVTNA